MSNLNQEVYSNHFLSRIQSNLYEQCTFTIGTCVGKFVLGKVRAVGVFHVSGLCRCRDRSVDVMFTVRDLLPTVLGLIIGREKKLFCFPQLFSPFDFQSNGFRARFCRE
jgi:hypothetical protein